MRKIGILTFHRSLNYGAVMQCYSLQQRLAKEFPDDCVEIVDYCTLRVQRKYSTKAWTYIFSSLPELRRAGVITVIKATIKNVLTVLRKQDFLKERKQMRKAFDHILQGMQLSEEHISTDDCAAASRWIQGKYDVLIVGSDCVWEINNYPFPNLYFLHDVSGAKKLSYAACAQGVLYESLTEGQRKYMKEAWSAFDYIGVRDIATEALLRAVDGELTIHQNCDPTVFLEIDAIPFDLKVLRNKFAAAGVDFSRPAICLMANSAVGKLCREALGTEYQIVAVYEQNLYADCFISDLTPFEWARCFSLFDLTVTNRFHGTLLSMKNGTPPITYDGSTDAGYSYNGMTKIRYLYEQLGLVDTHYRIAKQTFTSEDVQELRDSVEAVLKPEHVHAMTERLSMQAESYDSFSVALRNALSSSHTAHGRK